MALIYLVEITAGVPGSPTKRTLRVASAPKGYNHPTAPGYYPPHLIEAANVQRTVVAPRRTFGPSQIGGGEVRVQNIDGTYDEWFDYGYGHESRVLLVDSDGDYSSAVVMMTGKVEQPTGNKDEIVFRFRDRQYELDKQVSPSYYLGNNSGTDGTEGRPEDIKGQNKIRTLGEVFNVTPDPINANDQLYGVNHDVDGDFASVDSIVQRLNGSPWDNAGDDIDIANLQAASISQGDYRTCLDSGAFRRGGSAPGQGGAVTCDIVENSSEAENYIGDIAERLIQSAGVPPEQINNRLKSGSPTQAPWVAGLVLRSETILQGLDILIGPAGIVSWTDRLGMYQIALFDEPGIPVAGFKKFDYPNVAKPNEFKIIDLERITSNDEGSGVPAWRITLNYKRMWTVQDKDALASGLTDEEKEFYGREYRSLTWENPSIREQYPEAVELTFNTVLTRQDQAQLLLNHLAKLYGVARQMYRLTAQYDKPIAEAIDLLDTVQVTYDRYGLQNGKPFVITSLRYNTAQYIIQSEIWG